MDEGEIKRKLEELRKNRIVLTDDRPVRANIARGIIEPAAKGTGEKTRLTMDTPLSQVPKDADVARIIEERALLQKQAVRPRPPERQAPREQPSAQEQKQPAATQAAEEKPAQAEERHAKESQRAFQEPDPIQAARPTPPSQEPKPAPPLQEPKPQAAVNIARGIEAEQKTAKKKLGRLPKPPRPPYGRERKSFFEEVIGRRKPQEQETRQEPAAQAQLRQQEPAAQAKQLPQEEPEKQAPFKLSAESEKIEEEQFAQDLIQEGAGGHEPEESHGHTHRLYLRKEDEPAAGGKATQTQEEENAQEPLPEVKKVTAMAPADAARREETPQALEAAHSQLSDQSRPLSRREKRKLDEEGQKQPQATATSQAQEAPKPELTLQDIIGTPAGAEEKPAGLFGELEATAGGGQAAGEGRTLFSELESVAGGAAAKKPGVVNVEVKKESALACPTCKAANTRVVFCPYCGTGMCANCSPSIKTEGDLFIFTCPKCSEEVNVAKRA